MTGWGGGCVTGHHLHDGYYRQQSPLVIALGVPAGCGVASPPPGPDDPLSYLELGCGQGLGALVPGGEQPAPKVTAIDFNPAHVAAARARAQAGLDNAEPSRPPIWPRSPRTLPPRRCSKPDFVSMHGLWSWVPSTVQSGRPPAPAGGSRAAVHVSYRAAGGVAPSACSG